MSKTAETKTPGTPQDFVYAGRRESTKGTTCHVIYTLKEDGTLDEKLVYESKVFGQHGKTIGGVYTGARFDPKTAYGLTKASYARMFKDKAQAQVLGWEALDSEHMAEKAAKAQEGKTKPIIQQELLALRRIIHAARRRGAHSEAHAIINLIQQELHRPLTKEEQQ